MQPIVPMGAVIEQLGYSLVWSAGSCKLYPPNGKPLRLRVKNGCPEVVESQALTLISRLEEHKLEQVEELRRRTEQGKDRIRQAKLAMDKTWWDHLVDYVSSRLRGKPEPPRLHPIHLDPWPVSWHVWHLMSNKAYAWAPQIWGFHMGGRKTTRWHDGGDGQTFDGLL